MMNYKKIVLSAVFLATLGVLFVLAGQPVEAERQGGRTVSITANNSVGPVITVPSGSLVKLEWTATEKKSKGCTISADPYNESVRGIVSTQGALTLNVYTSATYTIGCYYYNPNVMVEDSITVNVSPVQPSITVTSPLNGDIWQVGASYQIKWNGNFNNLIYIYLNGGGHEEGYSKLITQVKYMSINNYDYNIAYIPTYEDLPVNSANTWKVFVCNGPLVSGGSNCGSSGEIYITPSITVISPNGGEVWQAGQTYQLQIACSEGISKTINIILLDYRAPAYGDYTKSFLFTGLTCRPGAVSNYYWTIPTSLYGNNVFKVVVETYDGSINDFSDNYFSIVAPK